MPREATGEVRRLADGFAARITIQGRTRRDFTLATCRTEDEAEARTAALATMAARLRRAGHADKTVKMMAAGAKARAGRPWEMVVAAVDILCAGTVEALTEAPTFADFAKEWTSGRLRERFPDHVRKKDGDDDDRLMRRYVTPVVPDVRVDEFTLDDADQIMTNLPAHLSPASRRHVAQVVRRVLALAVYPARLRDVNPIPRGWLPRVHVVHAFTFLYPDEDAILLRCSEISVVRRLFYGVGDREGMRREEAARLRWSDLNLERGLIRLDENKTDDPRAWALDPGVCRALAAWKKRSGASEGDLVFSVDGVPLYVHQLAEQLRADLKRAGVTRAELFEKTETRRPIRLHDLRASFVTVSLANGRTEAWVSDRTGHRSSEMLNRYRRAARTWAEAGLGSFLPLDEALPDLDCPAENPTARGNRSGRRAKLAERGGFEPPVPSRAHLISNQAPSATRTSLRPPRCSIRQVTVKPSNAPPRTSRRVNTVASRPRPGRLVDLRLPGPAPPRVSSALKVRSSAWRRAEGIPCMEKRGTKSVSRER